jgi:hypothetical protein
VDGRAIVDGEMSDRSHCTRTRGRELESSNVVAGRVRCRSCDRGRGTYK